MPAAPTSNFSPDPPPPASAANAPAITPPLLAPPVRTIAKLVRRDGSPGWLGGMRIRKKLIVLHTLFSLVLGLVLLLVLRPAIANIVTQSEAATALHELSLFADLVTPAPDRPAWSRPAAEARFQALPGVTLRSGQPSELGLSDQAASEAALARGRPVSATDPAGAPIAVLFLAGTPEGGLYYTLRAAHAPAALALERSYTVAFVALIGIYAAIAAALEIFVLPQGVYDPIRRMLRADQAVKAGQGDREIIPERYIPHDELGSIMRSRNETVLALRRQEQALAAALSELQRVAADLQRKNYLLESAQRNLADADRLASLGMMSAGIAHELNTPLAVLKGTVEQLNQDPAALDAPRAALMLRVVQRLEKLGESLLDFARVRPPASTPAALAPLVDEAATLVRLDRAIAAVTIHNRVAPDLVIPCDSDRMVQVFVNLIRNAADALTERRTLFPPAIEIDAAPRAPAPPSAPACVIITIADNGPGIDPEILPRLFEPFASTRLDARGTGLGLAVAEGIIREHGGMIQARNRAPGPGAVFEVTLPLSASTLALSSSAHTPDSASVST